MLCRSRHTRVILYLQKLTLHSPWPSISGFLYCVCYVRSMSCCIVASVIYTELSFFHTLHTSTAAKFTVVWLEVFTGRKFLPISPPALVGENFIHKLFSYVNDCIEDMATFTVLAKILSANYSCNTEVHVAGLVKFVSHKIMVFYLM